MTKCPTIAIDASRANRPLRTGVEWYAFYVIQGLKRLIPPEYKVILYSEEPLRDGLEELPSHWESRVLAWPPRRLWTQLRFSWEMLVHPPSALFVPAYVPPLSALFLHGRTLTTLHDPAFITFPAAYSPHGRLFLNVLYRVALAAGPVLTVSEFSKGELVRLFRVDPRRITVTPLGYDARRFRPLAPDGTQLRAADNAALAATLRRHELEGAPYFIFVGRLETKKNLGGLLKAFVAYKLQRPNDTARLVLVGKPGHGYDAEWRALDDALAAAEKSGVDAAVKQRIRADVRRLGYAAPDDMRYLYAGATAMTFVSRYEGFGIPLLEAFGCGTPVLTSNTTSLPEVAGDAALFVDPENVQEITAGMARLADDAALRDDLRAKGAARAKEYSWERTASATWEALKKLAQP